MSDLVTVQDAGAYLQAVVPLPGHLADAALAAFTDPVVLAMWWGGGELVTDLTAGGPYLVRFPALERTMTGTIVRYEPPTRLEFTWSWDHEVEPGRHVTVTTSAASTLTIIHGPYGDSEAELAARAEHRAGWEYFLPKLAAMLLSR